MTLTCGSGFRHSDMRGCTTTTKVGVAGSNPVRPIQPRSLPPISAVASPCTSTSSFRTFRRGSLLWNCPSDQRNGTTRLSGRPLRFLSHPQKQHRNLPTTLRRWALCSGDSAFVCEGSREWPVDSDALALPAQPASGLILRRKVFLGPAADLFKAPYP